MRVRRNEKKIMRKQKYEHQREATEELHREGGSNKRQEAYENH